MAIQLLSLAGSLWDAYTLPEGTHSHSGNPHLRVMTSDNPPKGCEMTHPPSCRASVEYETSITGDSLLSDALSLVRGMHDMMLFSSLKTLSFHNPHTPLMSCIFSQGWGCQWHKAQGRHSTDPPGIPTESSTFRQANYREDSNLLSKYTMKLRVSTDMTAPASRGRGKLSCLSLWPET